MLQNNKKDAHGRTCTNVIQVFQVLLLYRINVKISASDWHQALAPCNSNDNGTNRWMYTTVARDYILLHAVSSSLLHTYRLRLLLALYYVIINIAAKLKLPMCAGSNSNNRHGQQRRRWWRQIASGADSCPVIWESNVLNRQVDHTRCIPRDCQKSNVTVEHQKSVKVLFDTHGQCWENGV